MSDRFEINKAVAGIPDGTVTDTDTGLTWLRTPDPFGNQQWQDAVDKCASLHGDSANDFLLLDGSKAGDWRMPTMSEMLTLVDYTQFQPCLPSELVAALLASVPDGVGAQDTGYYWTSTNDATAEAKVWHLNLVKGDGNTIAKKQASEEDFGEHVWPVRDA